MKCGLLGRKLGHSYSPLIHHYLDKNYEYVLFEKEPEEVGDFLKNGDFLGINVTMPYKKTVMEYLDELSPAAKKMGCVNTIVRRKDGTLFGHNSDYYGFVSLVKHSGIEVAGKKVLVLGSGGASNAALRGLEDLGALPVVISRTGENNYGNLHLHEDAAVIVNTTPVGMYPNTGVSPIDLNLFPHLEGVLDVIYNPARTRLLLDAEARGLPAENGLWMLVAQAKEASEYFTNGRFHDQHIDYIYRHLIADMQNVMLIGMPGCGKSTVGAMLAEYTARKFVDLDEEVVKLAGKSIPEIFAQDGEEVFRDYETQVLEAYGKQSGLIIATGGGCVTRARNHPLIRQNSQVFWLQRDAKYLETSGRPLSLLHNLDNMYVERSPMYDALADYVVDNNRNCDSTVFTINTLMEIQP